MADRYGDSGDKGEEVLVMQCGMLYNFKGISTVKDAVVSCASQHSCQYSIEKHFAVSQHTKPAISMLSAPST